MAPIRGVTCQDYLTPCTPQITLGVWRSGSVLALGARGPGFKSQHPDHPSPGWRNGRRNGLKIRRSQDREGSIPSPGTISPD